MFSNRQLRLTALLFAFLAAVAVGPIASAATQESYQRIVNKWQPDRQINVEKGPVEASAAQPGWFSADWVFEPIPGTADFKIRNRWKGGYLTWHGSEQQFVLGPYSDSAVAQWELLPVSGDVYRIRSPNSSAYIHIENGKLEFGLIQPGWESAQWRLPGFTNSAADLFAVTNPARERQCVKNIFGTGVVALVDWYSPENVVLIQGVIKGVKSQTARVEGKGFKHEKIAVLQSSCVQERKRMIALVRISGAVSEKELITLALGTAIATGAGIACVGTVVFCPQLAVLGGSVMIDAASAMGKDDARKIFYAGAPGMLEVSGTAFNPKIEETRPWGSGSIVGARCESNADCRNNACARATAAENAPKTCCAGADTRNYGGYDYCASMPNGSICWSDAMCGSGNCSGNWSGTRRGTCS